jgi:SOS-response transcriptional repressor LexA
VRAADWQNTPPTVRVKVDQLAAAARQGRELAGWLKDAAGKRAGGGKSLDELFRKGELAKRVEAMLEPPDAPLDSPLADPNAAAGGTSGGAEAKGKGGKAVKDALNPGLRSAHPPSAHPGVRHSPSSGGIDPRVPVGYLVPLINRVAAGYPSEFTDLDYPVRVADEYISCPGLADPQAFAARVVGESMLPDYREGDVVIFSPAAKVGDGCDCFVRFEVDHETTFKRVFFEEKGKRVRLQPLNPKFAATVVAREDLAGLYRAVSRYAKL